MSILSPPTFDARVYGMTQVLGAGQVFTSGTTWTSGPIEPPRGSRTAEISVEWSASMTGGYTVAVEYLTASNAAVGAAVPVIAGSQVTATVAVPLRHRRFRLRVQSTHGASRTLLALGVHFPSPLAEVRSTTEVATEVIMPAGTSTDTRPTDTGAERASIALKWSATTVARVDVEYVSESGAVLAVDEGVYQSTSAEPEVTTTIPLRWPRLRLRIHNQSAGARTLEVAVVSAVRVVSQPAASLTSARTEIVRYDASNPASGTNASDFEPRAVRGLNIYLPHIMVPRTGGGLTMGDLIGLGEQSIRVVHDLDAGITVSLMPIMTVGSEYPPGLTGPEMDLGALPAAPSGEYSLLWAVPERDPLMSDGPLLRVVEAVSLRGTWPAWRLRIVTQDAPTRGGIAVEAVRRYL